MIQLALSIELLAIIALIAGVPVPIAGTVALIAATPTTAIALRRIFKIKMTAMDAVDIAFLFFTWALLPCLSGAARERRCRRERVTIHCRHSSVCCSQYLEAFIAKETEFD